MLSTTGKTTVFICLLCTITIFVLSGSSWNIPVHLYSRHFPNSSVAKCSCRRCFTEGDPRFREFINASPKPFLARNTTSEEGFIWWTKLQNSERNFGLYNTTVDNLLQMFPPRPDVESSPDRCRTCAVVGNSANLIRSHYGSLIDFHDIVIRMNHGRTKGYQADVGTKTTHHVMYPESAINLDNTTHLVLFPFKLRDFQWLIKAFNKGKNPAVNSKTIANKDLVKIINPDFMKYAHKIWLGNKGRYPSTGFMTLLFSMHICDKVSVFGFGPDSEGNWSHYFEILRNKWLRTGPHPGKEEYNVIEQLHEKKMISFFRGF